MGHVNIFTDPLDLKMSVVAQVLPSARVMYIVDAQTSRTTVSSAYLQVVHDIVLKSGQGNYTIEVVCGHRPDLLAVVFARCQKLLLEMHINICTMQPNLMIPCCLN